MALNLETLSVALKLDSGNFTTGMNQAQSRLDGFRDRMGRFGQSLTSFGTRMTAAVTLPLTAMFGAMIGGASDLTEAQNLVDVVYGESADVVTDWAEANANAYGMTQSAALATTGTLGNLFTNMGIGRDVAAGMSTELVGLSGDLASFFNVSQPAVIEAMTSAFVGEYDSLQRLGIPINAAAVEQYALNNGIWDGVDALTDQERVLAVNGLLWENTTNAQGDAARTANSWANMQRRVKAKLLDTAAAMGKHLLPLAESLGKRFEGLIDTFNSLSPTTQRWIVAILALAAALGPVLIIIGMMLPAIGALAAVVAFFLSPIGLVIAAVALLAYLFRDELLGAISPIVEKFQELKKVFDEYLAISGDPMLAALGALQKVFPALTNVIAPLRDMVFNLRDAFQQFKDGNYGAAFSSLALAAGNLWDAIWTAISSIDWWGLATAAAGWLGTQIGLIPWGEYITGLGTFGADLKSKLENAITTGVDWNGLGVKLGEKVAELGPIMAEAAVGMIEDFAAGAGDPGAWGTVALAFGAGLMLLPGSIATYIGGLMVQPAMDLLMGFVEGLDLNWVLVGFWFTLMGTRVLTAIGDLSATIVVKGTELITGFLTGAKDYWTGTVGPWLSTRKEQASSLVGNVLSTLVPKGTELITGMLTGAKNYWTGSVQPYLHERGAQAFASIGSLSSTLVSKGLDLIQGMLNGIKTRWNIASSWLSSIPGKAQNAVGSLGGILVSAGASLIQGLIDGIDSKIDDLTSKLSVITGLIPDFKGPPEKDAKLLFGNGLLIMQGLGRGLDRGWSDVTRQLSGYTSAIGGDFGSSVAASAIGGAGQQAPVIQIITLEPGKWAEFLANAEAGGTFAREFGAELGLMEGVA